jgi:DNA-binding GntR family transcriptional regulator
VASATSNIRRKFNGEVLDGLTDDTALNNKAYEILRENILAGGFAPGTHLNIRPIAEELGMSSTPVREALSRLRADGGLEALANRAFRIPVPTPETYREIMIMRIKLEWRCCRTHV